jgi:hypothetical protein
VPLLALLACRLPEGEYAFDYETVDVDSCDIYQGGQIADDAEGDLSYDGDVLVFEFDGTDDPLAFVVQGTTFSRTAADEVWLNDVCWLAVEQEDVGEQTSGTTFAGRTEWVGVLEGDCGVFDAFIDDPCRVEFDWSGELEE